MALKTETFTLEGKDGESFAVSISQLPATRAHELYKRVVRAGAKGGASTKGETDWATVLASISGVLEEEEFIRKELLVMVRVNGQEVNTPPKFDAAFNGNMKMAYQILGLSLKVNLNDFFDGKLDLMVERAKEMLSSKTQTWTSPSGRSTGSSTTDPAMEPSTTGKPGSP